MNRIEKRMFEDMAERISKLNDELVTSSREYDCLFEEVIEFFINVNLIFLALLNFFYFPFQAVLNFS